MIRRIKRHIHTGELHTNKYTYTGYCIIVHWLAMANYSIQPGSHQHIHSHTQTQTQAIVELGRGGEGGQERGEEKVEVGGDVTSRCIIVFWTWAIFQRGRGVIRSASPFDPPSPWRRLNFPFENQDGPCMSGALVIEYINGATKHQL